MPDPVSSRAAWRDTLFFVEWLFTIIFTLEYIARVVSVSKPRG
jgi:hypothetical protein